MKNLLATLTKYKATQAQLDSLTALLKEQRAEIETYMKEKGVDTLTCGQYVAKIIPCTKKSLDEKKIRELFPDVAQATEKVTEYNRFMVK